MVRPAGPATPIQTALGRQYNVQPDGTFEMLADDAKYFIHNRWFKIAEWTQDEDEEE